MLMHEKKKSVIPVFYVTGTDSSVGRMSPPCNERSRV